MKIKGESNLEKMSVGVVKSEMRSSGSGSDSVTVPGMCGGLRRLRVAIVQNGLYA